MFRGLLAAAIFISMVGYSSCADLNNEVTEEKMKVSEEHVGTIHVVS